MIIVILWVFTELARPGVYPKVYPKLVVTNSLTCHRCSSLTGFHSGFFAWGDGGGVEGEELLF